MAVYKMMEDFAFFYCHSVVFLCFNFSIILIYLFADIFSHRLYWADSTLFAVKYIDLKTQEVLLLYANIKQQVTFFGVSVYQVSLSCLLCVLFYKRHLQRRMMYGCTWTLCDLILPFWHQHVTGELVHLNPHNHGIDFAITNVIGYYRIIYKLNEKKMVEKRITAEEVCVHVTCHVKVRKEPCVLM